MQKADTFIKDTLNSTRKTEFDRTFNLDNVNDSFWSQKEDKKKIGFLDNLNTSLESNLTNLHKNDPAKKKILELRGVIPEIKGIGRNAGNLTLFTMQFRRGNRNRRGVSRSRPVFVTDHYHFKEGVPRSLDFTRRQFVMVHVDCKGKIFPAHVSLDSQRMVFEYYITFQGRPPTEMHYDSFL